MRTVSKFFTIILFYLPFLQNFVLTAGHCCYYGSAEYSAVVAGEHDLSQDSGKEQVLMKKSFSSNPKS
jgi:hypothetical protein